jgi:hypothetical protein
MTAATAEALAKTLNALVREGWDEPSSHEIPQDRRQLKHELVEAQAALIELMREKMEAVRVSGTALPSAS